MEKRGTRTRKGERRITYRRPCDARDGSPPAVTSNTRFYAEGEEGIMPQFVDTDRLSILNPAKTTLHIPELLITESTKLIEGSFLDETGIDISLERLVGALLFNVINQMPHEKLEEIVRTYNKARVIDLKRLET